MESAHKATIVITTYNSDKFIVDCLNNLLADESLEQPEIIVIDNNSTDKTPDLLKGYRGDITVIYNKRNIGYGRACNQGFRKSRYPFILFMNPDAFPQQGVIRNLIRFMRRNPGTGAASCRLLNPDRSIQYSCREYLRPSFLVMRALEKYSARAAHFLNKQYLMAGHDHTVNKSVPWLTGAFVMVRRDSFEAMGGFDEGYFLYCEDADLCLRLNMAGWTVDYAAEAGDAVHVHQRRSRLKPLSRETFIHAASIARFFFKNSPYISASGHPTPGHEDTGITLRYPAPTRYPSRPTNVPDVG
ncbi:MAG: glycosyltransferase family 2 protein [Candidatus Omnitrophica bacterium]|nr:glycosyltransferase family 2 protein [Candidatus Omnitrophota bacterium]